MTSPKSTSWADISEEDEALAQQASALSAEEPIPSATEEEEPSADPLDKVNLTIKRDDQQDPNSPLYSVKSFEELSLSPNLLKGVYQGMGFSKPSAIQEAALPIILNAQPRNMIAQAKSGTGKTAAFVLCMLHRVEIEKKQPQALCVVNTRELANQVLAVVTKMGQFTGATTYLAVAQDTRGTKHDYTAQIVIGTPGKTLDMIKKKPAAFSGLKVFVLDEADTMLDLQGLGDTTMRIKLALQARNKKLNSQVLLFSATFSDKVKDYAKNFVPRPVDSIFVEDTSELRVDKISQFKIKCGASEKSSVLSDLYNYMTIGQCIIFVNTRDTAMKLAAFMQKEGHKISVLHGGKEVTGAQRDQIMGSFRDGQTKVLIATNVISRGIDVIQVSLVVNYDLPVYQGEPVYSSYLHRIGRAGRFDQNGIAINFIAGPADESDLAKIEKHFNTTIKEIPLDKIEDVDTILKELN